MFIKKVGLEEIDALAILAKQLYADEPSDIVMPLQGFKDMMLGNLNNGCSAYYIMDDEENKIMGYALVNLKKTPYYLVHFFMAGEYRRGGNGTKAFNLLMEELKTDSIDLDVFCWNERGKGFWGSLGFEERAIIMRKQPSKK